MMNIQMVDLRGQYDKIKEEVNAGIQEVLDSTAFINGSKVREFSGHLADYCGVKHVIPCGNGTDALQIALMALGLQPGDRGNRACLHLRGHGRGHRLAGAHACHGGRGLRLF